jgi:hypothetical protein
MFKITFDTNPNAKIRLIKAIQNAARDADYPDSCYSTMGLHYTKQMVENGVIFSEDDASLVVDLIARTQVHFNAAVIECKNFDWFTTKITRYEETAVNFSDRYTT